MLSKKISLILPLYCILFYLSMVREVDNIKYVLLNIKYPILLLCFVAFIFIMRFIYSPLRSILVNTLLSLLASVQSTVFVILIIININSYIGEHTIYVFEGKIIQKIEYEFSKCQLVIESKDLRDIVYRDISISECKNVNTNENYSFKSYKGLLGIYYNKNSFIGVYIIYLLSIVFPIIIYYFDR